MEEIFKTDKACETRYTQFAEVSLDDYWSFTEALMKNGYEVKCRLDKESNVVIVDFIHPDHTGHFFDEVGFEYDN